MLNRMHESILIDLYRLSRNIDTLEQLLHIFTIVKNRFNYFDFYKVYFKL